LPVPSLVPRSTPLPTMKVTNGFLEELLDSISI